MPDSPKVDVAVNIFAKPYQTSLSLLSLLRYSGRHIDRIFLQFEPSGSVYDTASPYAIADYLGDRAVIFQPEYWLKLEAADLSRLADPRYRLSIRYQHAFEHSQKRFLFVMHNDVLIKRDIIGAMLEQIDGAFAVGQIGQCWNCPAKNAELLAAAGLDAPACTPQNYRDFQPDFDGLKRLYEAARAKGVFVRPYWEGWDLHYSPKAWPLPECRVNEWGCLVDLEQTRNLAMPLGAIPPFGAFEACGSICLDTAVAWFRELNRHGLHARHMDIAPYLTHWVGTGKMTSYKYSAAEGNARTLLAKGFKEYADWCLERGNGLFA